LTTLTFIAADVPSTAFENGGDEPSFGPAQAPGVHRASRADIFAEYDVADSAARGVPLRRVGLCSSHLSEWRKACDSGALAGFGPDPSGASLDLCDCAGL